MRIPLCCQRIIIVGPMSTSFRQDIMKQFTKRSLQAVLGWTKPVSETGGRKTADPDSQLIHYSQEWPTKSQPDEKNEKIQRSEVDGAAELCNYCRPGDFIRRHGPVFAVHCRNTEDLLRSAKSERNVSAFSMKDSLSRL